MISQIWEFHWKKSLMWRVCCFLWFPRVRSHHACGLIKWKEWQFLSINFSWPPGKLCSVNPAFLEIQEWEYIGLFYFLHVGVHFYLSRKRTSCSFSLLVKYFISNLLPDNTMVIIYLNIRTCESRNEDFWANEGVFISLESRLVNLCYLHLVCIVQAGYIAQILLLPHLC